MGVGCLPGGTGRHLLTQKGPSGSEGSWRVSKGRLGEAMAGSPGRTREERKTMMGELERKDLKEYRKLVGKTIRSIVCMEGHWGRRYGLGFSDGSLAWIDRDREGTGPGHLWIDYLASETGEKGGRR